MIMPAVKALSIVVLLATLSGCGLCLGSSGGSGGEYRVGAGPCPPGYKPGPVEDDERR